VAQPRTAPRNVGTIRMQDGRHLTTGQQQAIQTSERRYVSGRYRVHVEALDPQGRAVGHVTATLHAPGAEQLAEVFGGRNAEPQPEMFAFVGGLPGEDIEVEASWSLPHPGRKRARRVPPPSVHVLRVVQASPQRVAPVCPVFGQCGGCQLQHLAYEDQLHWKTERIRALLRAAGFEHPPVIPTIGCEPPWHYRNHMRFSVDRDGRPGLTVLGSHRVLPLRSCPIASSRINNALTLLAETPQQRPQALVRCGEATGQLLLQPAAAPDLRTRLTAAGFDLRDDAIEERLHDATFRIRPSSFFQTNTRQANRMAELVLELLPSGPDVTLVDAYCGVGTFARLMAPAAGRVLAIEESASAIRDAEWNLRDVDNVTILRGKVEDLLPSLTERLDGLVIDPPRAGCQRSVLDALIARQVPRVVYVSCGPDTLARDLAYLCLRQDAYRVSSVQPLDMFPQTAHIETVTLLEAV
jgi:23S rRNA (uracil1939-C5)-methyltransferase